MLPDDFDKIKPEHLLQLVSDKVSENRLLDYKQELPIKKKDSDTREFLGDISAFANAAGGDIIYGVTEETDTAGKKTGRPGNAIGLQLTGETIDEVVRRLHQISQSGLDPAIPGLRIGEIVAEEKTFIAVRIPHSWISPHMVSLDGGTKFFVRIDNAKVAMDREQIRQAFLFSESTRMRIERFRDERLGRILSGEIGVPLQRSWERIVHLIPIAALSGSLSIDLSVVYPLAGNSPKFAGILPRRFNVDGVMCASDLTRQHPSRQFIQVFRNGIVETIQTGGMDQPNLRGDIPGVGTENNLITDFANCFEFFRSQSVPMPIVALVSFLNMHGRHLLMGEHVFSHTENSFDRSNILLPELVFDSYDMDTKTALMPLIDAFWQAGGHRRSPSYNRVT